MTKETTLDYHSLNAMLNLVDADGGIQFEADKEAVRQYFLQHVNQNTVFFHNLEEKIHYLIEEGYYESEFFKDYEWEDVKSLFKQVYDHKFRFETFLGAYKFYTSYALKTWDGKRYLERFEDRVVMNALYLARGDMETAKNLAEEIITGRFQPATPTFLNCGKKARGELISCFLNLVGDSMESIGRAVNSSLQLSRRGGGVALNLTDLREHGAPIKNIEGQSSGVVPVMKMLEDAFSYANQLGSRQGAGAVYLNAHHPDILTFLDTKRENADEKIRIKTLSLGIVVPDITFELAKQNKDMYLFSPYDIQRVYGKPMSEISITEKYKEMVDSPEIRKKKINARKLFQAIAEVQFESGYPYLMFDDTVNAANPIDGRINMSNLCVHGDTKILTKEGHKTISDVAGTKQTVWNGEEYSEVDVVKTGEDKELLKVTLSDGKSLTCTPEHKWYLEDGTEVRTRELFVNDNLLPWVNPEGGHVAHQVVSIEIVEGLHDTYCFTEPKRHMGVFNGILTGQCSEILQVNEHSELNDDLSYKHLGRDISCNLGSLNIAKAMEGGNLASTVESAIRALTAVSEMSKIDSVPSIRRGNDESRAIGLGQMNLHGFLAKEHIHYGSAEGLDFTNVYFATILYNCLKASNTLAKEKGETFVGFDKSKYADGSFFTPYLEDIATPVTVKVKELVSKYNLEIPTEDQWLQLKEEVMESGLYNAYLQAVPPTGSISYINNSTASIHPITSKVEIRKEGKIGRVYYPAPYLDNENSEYYKDAYEIGAKAIIDTYAVATKYVDQGLSLTLFFNAGITTRDINKAQIYAWKNNIKTLYYIRMRQEALEGTEVEGCVSCSL